VASNIVRVRGIVFGAIRDPDLGRTACTDVVSRRVDGIALIVALGAILPPALKGWLALCNVLLGVAVSAIISLELEHKVSFWDGLLEGVGTLFVAPPVDNRTIKEGLVSIRGCPWRSFFCAL
jgi:hypothetical protein